MQKKKEKKRSHKCHFIQPMVLSSSNRSWHAVAVDLNLVGPLWKVTCGQKVV